MKKSSFTAMILGTVAGVLFALGMCMVLVTDLGSTTAGVVLGCIGLAIGFAAVIVWRKMEHKVPIRITGKAVLSIILGIFGTLGLGVGMCCTMIWDMMVPGIIIGLAGILLLLCLIPIGKGIKD